MIRPVTLQDAPAITSIYNEYVEHSVATFETVPVSVETMRTRIAETIEAYPYIVYETEGEVVAYSYVHAWKTRKAYEYTAETTIFVHPDHKRKGIGLELVRQLIEVCRQRNIHVLIACITASNTASVIMHEKLGFQKVAHYHEVGWKFDQWLDVADYQLTL
ncbi:MAG: GNAT family N-acetyltransferase [Bacteroidales bacterium]|nr:GNAT family N-acetyltransferase [Bacteroidales bacterium]